MPKSSIAVQVVNYLLRGWIKNLESQGFVALPLLDDESGRCDVAKDLEFVLGKSKKIGQDSISPDQSRQFGAV